MKLFLTLILLIMVFSVSYAEKSIELSTITLPYESLKLEEIFAINSTILVRSGNTIYKSIDNGENWEISYESNVKINQFYASDPHTILLVGDSGLVMRTFDYGYTWFDVSYKTDHNFRGIAAKTFEEYLIVTNSSYIYNKLNQTTKLFPIQSVVGTPVYNVIYKDSAYFFGGGYSRRNFYADGAKRTEYKLPYYIFDGVSTTYEPAEYELSLYETIGDYASDSLTFFKSENGLFFCVVNDGEAGFTFNNVIDLIFDMPSLGVVVHSDRIKYIDNPDEDIMFFTREGHWGSINIEYFLDFNKPPDLKYLDELEHQNLNIKPINSVYKTDSNSYIISSNNSTIYRAKIKDLISNVDNIEVPEYKLFGDIIRFNDDVKILAVTNYIGQNIIIEELNKSLYKLPIGLNFITYSDGKTIKSIKVGVIK